MLVGDTAEEDGMLETKAGLGIMLAGIIGGLGQGPKTAP